MRELKISVYSHQDDFLELLYSSEREFEGQITAPQLTTFASGNKTFSFDMPFCYENIEGSVNNSRWNYITHHFKIRVERDNQIDEFVMKDYQEERSASDELMMHVNCISLAEFELSQVGYSLALNENSLRQFVQGEDPNDPDSKQIGVYDGTIDFWEKKLLGYKELGQDAEGNKVISWQYDWDYRVESYYDKPLIPGIEDNRISTKLYENNVIANYTDDNRPIYAQEYTEKQRIISVEKSNIWNIQSELCSKFEVFPTFEIKYGEDGKILHKTIVLKNDIPQDALFTLRYTKNEKSISRNVDSSQIVTKMYVNNLTNENVDSGLVSISDNDANFMRENYILDLDWYMGKIKDEELNQETLIDSNLQYRFPADSVDTGADFLPIPEQNCDNTENLLKVYKERTRARNLNIEAIAKQVMQKQAEYIGYCTEKEYKQAQRESALEEYNKIMDEWALCPQGVQTKYGERLYAYQIGPNLLVRFSEKGILDRYIDMRNYSVIIYPKSAANLYNPNGTEITDASTLRWDIFEREPITGSVTAIKILNAKIGDKEHYGCFSIDLLYNPLEFYEQLKNYWKVKADSYEKRLQDLGLTPEEGAIFEEGKENKLIITTFHELQKLKNQLYAAKLRKEQERDKVEKMFYPYIRDGYWEDSDYGVYANKGKKKEYITPTTTPLFNKAVNQVVWSDEWHCFKIPNNTLLNYNPKFHESIADVPLKVYDVIDIDSIEIMTENPAAANSVNIPYKNYVKGTDFDVEYGYVTASEVDTAGKLLDNTQEKELGIFIKFFNTDTLFKANQWAITQQTRLFVRAKARSNDNYILAQMIGPEYFRISEGVSKRKAYCQAERIIEIEDENVILNSIRVNVSTGLIHYPNTHTPGLYPPVVPNPDFRPPVLPEANDREPLPDFGDIPTGPEVRPPITYSLANTPNPEFGNNIFVTDPNEAVATTYELIYGRDYYSFKDTKEYENGTKKTIAKIHLNETTNAILTTAAVEKIMGDKAAWYDVTYDQDITSKFYFNDALEVMEDFKKPQVSYDISVLDLTDTIHPEYDYSHYRPMVGTRIPIYDKEMRFDGITGFINEVKEDLFNGMNTTITITNYKDKFEDLFQKITQTTVALSQKEYTYDRINQLIDTSGGAPTINHNILQQSLEDANEALSMSKDNDVEWGAEGIILTNKNANENGIYGKVKITSGGIFVSEDMDNNGNYKWTSAITPDSINANLLRSGHLDTQSLTLWNNTEPRFLWNESGIHAYNTFENGLTNYNSFVRFNKDGLVFREYVDLVEKTKIGNMLIKRLDEQQWSATDEDGEILPIQKNINKLTVTANQPLRKMNLQLGLDNFYSLDGTTAVGIKAKHKYYCALEIIPQLDLNAYPELKDSQINFYIGFTNHLQEFSFANFAEINADDEIINWKPKRLSFITEVPLTLDGMKDKFEVLGALTKVSNNWGFAISKLVVVDITENFTDSMMYLEPSLELLNSLPIDESANSWFYNNFSRFATYDPAVNPGKIYQDALTLDWNGLKISAQNDSLALTAQKGLQVFAKNEVGKRYNMLTVGAFETNNSETNQLEKHYGMIGYKFTQDTPSFAQKCFQLDENGLWMSGKIVATEGSIGGFTIGADAIYSGNKSSLDSPNEGIYLGSKDGIALGRELVDYGRNNLHNVFEVDSRGKMYANNATLQGKITADSGKIGGFTITANSLYNTRDSLDSGLAGVYIGTDGISVGKSSSRNVILRKEGGLEAKGADISGTITATAGEIGDFVIENGRLYISGQSIYEGFEFIELSKSGFCCGPFVANAMGGVSASSIAIQRGTPDSFIGTIGYLKGFDTVKSTDCFGMVSNANASIILESHQNIRLRAGEKNTGKIYLYGKELLFNDEPIGAEATFG